MSAPRAKGALLALLFALAAADAHAEAPKPWRLTEALGQPLWLDLSLSHRSRFEYLSDQFRRGQGGSDRGLALRTLVAAELRWAPLALGVEFADMRHHLADDDAPLNTTLENPLDLLSLYLRLRLEEVFGDEGRLDLRVGRLTLDVGSRRLLGRNRFRNTINAFTGVDLRWSSPEVGALRAFALLPVQRRPSDAASLRDHDFVRDRERTETVFWGLFYRTTDLAPGLHAEAYLFGLHEQDGGDEDGEGTATDDRRLWTPGLRVLREPKAGRLDVELELALQLGTSRASKAADDDRDLDHLAFYARVAVGYTLAVPTAPRLQLSYEHASGDADPDDDDNGRFDTLFGTRRFAYGPTGIYGLLARSNLRSPEARVTLRPLRGVALMLAYRLAWLAERRDAWTTASLRDPSGATGSFIGQQLEARVRWDVLPGNLRLEAGFARAWLGDVAELPRLDGGAKLDDMTYVYTQLSVQI
jgi:hypothetical protein